MAFIRILSPNKAPPVFFFDGSTEITAIVFSVNACRYLLTISSVTELFPAPPVPVIPRTGIDWMLDAGYWVLDTGYWILDCPFSALVIWRAILRTSFTSPRVIGF